MMFIINGILEFVLSQPVWVLFAVVVLWIAFIPQIDKFSKRRPKSQRYFVE